VGDLLDERVRFAIDHAVPPLDRGAADGLGQMAFAAFGPTRGRRPPPRSRDFARFRDLRTVNLVRVVTRIGSDRSATAGRIGRVPEVKLGEHSRKLARETPELDVLIGGGYTMGPPQ
jgi:hypothetical protein